VNFFCVLPFIGTGTGKRRDRRPTSLMNGFAGGGIGGLCEGGAGTTGAAAHGDARSRWGLDPARDARLTRLRFLIEIVRAGKQGPKTACRSQFLSRIPAMPLSSNGLSWSDPGYRRLPTPATRLRGAMSMPKRSQPTISSAFRPADLGSVRAVMRWSSVARMPPRRIARPSR
jgi:hypothetical protein